MVQKTKAAAMKANVTAMTALLTTNAMSVPPITLVMELHAQVS